MAATLVAVPMKTLAQGGAVGPPTLLQAGSTTHRLKADAKEAEVLAYNGALPGPPIRVLRGEEFRIALRNDLAQPTTLHWHGVRLPNAMDGVGGLTQQPVAREATFDIRFTPKDAGTFWYRPLVPQYAAEQTERGLYGLFLVEDEKPLPFDRDLALIVDDILLDADGRIAGSFGTVRETALAGRLGNMLLVNGHEGPERLHARPGSRLRLRILNAANARPFLLKSEGFKLAVLAVDGQPTEPFSPSRGDISLAPGGRVDLALDVPREPGARGMLIAGTGMPVLTVEADGERSLLSDGPFTALPRSDLPAAIELQRARRADLAIEGGLDPRSAAAEGTLSVPDPSRVWKINGVSWPDAAAKPVLSVKSGTPVSFGFLNRTPFLQALHVHGHHVRLLHQLDDGWEPYWLDTVPVAPGATARIAFVADNPGRWMIGSSILERLATGLAAWFEVT
jgi:FtsP/CotA-like multicopper oxidase with cupredoxin domain